MEILLEPTSNKLLVDSKRRAFWSLNEDILKITILKTNTPYPSRRYGVSVPALTKDHRGIKLNTPYPERLNTPYSRYDIRKIKYSGRYQTWSLLQETPNTPANPTDCLSLVTEQIFPTGGSNCKENGGNQQFSNEPDENPLSKNRLCVLRTLIDEVSSSLFAEMKEQIEPIRKKIKKVNEKVYAAQVGCKQCKGPHYTKDCPLKEEGKTLEEAYYMQFGGPFQGGRYRATAMGWCMTRSSANKLFTPPKEPEREFRSSRRHFKTLSLDELRSPDFNLLSDQEYSEEEETEAMAETMEQYMSKTQTDYGSGVARPKIDNKDQFELKGQFLKEL
ncbi:integrase, catalytic region, zinc finger, CCHC-type containing protein [Tanacetum coccineum]